MRANLCRYHSLANDIIYFKRSNFWRIRENFSALDFRVQFCLICRLWSLQHDVTGVKSPGRCWDVTGVKSTGRGWEVTGVKSTGRCWEVTGVTFTGRCWEVTGAKSTGRCWEVTGMKSTGRRWRWQEWSLLAAGTSDEPQRVDCRPDKPHRADCRPD